MGLLIPTKHLERKALSDFASYEEDKETATAFERPNRFQMLLSIIGCGGGLAGLAIISLLAFFEGGESVKFFGGCFLIIFVLSFLTALYQTGRTARRTAVSLRSGKEMKTYLRTDPPDDICAQFIYVCDESRTYFLRTYSAASSG
jgi:hypothetical protein